MNAKAVPAGLVTRSGEAVPLLDLSRQYAPIRAEILAAIGQVCDSQHFILGEAVAEFEKSAAQFLGTSACIGCNSGTDALFLALAAAGIGAGDEVVTTAFSFFASASAIVRVGARPVFADIDLGTFNLDASAVEQMLDHRVRVKATMPVHLFGQCADMDKFCSIGKQRKLAIIEDAAQAFGATWRGRRAGALGDLGCFSFYPTKNLSAFGDAGCVTSNDEALAARVRLLRNHGMPRRYLHEEIGWNSRLDSIQAAVLSVKLKHLERWNRERQERARTYFNLFESAGLAGANSPIRLPQSSPPASHIYHQFTILAAARDELRKFLTERQIGSEIFYPIPIHRQPCFDYLGYGEGSLPKTEQAAREALSLPMFAEITQDEQQTVVAAIADFYS